MMGGVSRASTGQTMKGLHKLDEGFAPNLTERDFIHHDAHVTAYRKHKEKMRMIAAFSAAVLASAYKPNRTINIDTFTSDKSPRLTRFKPKKVVSSVAIHAVIGLTWCLGLVEKLIDRGEQNHVSKDSKVP